MIKKYIHQIDVEIGQDFTNVEPDPVKLTDIPSGKKDLSKIVGKPFLDFSVDAFDAAPVVLKDPLLVQHPVNIPVYQPLELEENTGSAPYVWEVDALPPGLTLTDEGVIKGTPTTQGNVPSNITVTDSNNTSYTRGVTWFII